jgi:hypothetical protein
MTNRSAQKTIFKGSLPVNASGVLELFVPPELLLTTPELPLEALTLKTNVARWVAPEIVSVCEPGSKAVGRVTVAVTLPALSATAEPIVIGSDCTVMDVVSPGLKPDAETVIC